MNERLQRDFELLQGRYSEAQFREEGQWILLPKFSVPNGGWERKEYAICFQLRAGYPDIGPYSFNASPLPRGTAGQVPGNYTDSFEPKPPFEGAWGKFSWELDGWKPMPDLVSGSTLLNFVESIRKRFEQGT